MAASMSGMAAQSWRKAAAGTSTRRRQVVLSRDGSAGPAPQLVTHVDAMAIEGFSDHAEQLITNRAPVRKVIVPIRSPRCDHCKHEDPAVAKQEWIGECVVIANLVGCVGYVELDWPVATRLEVDEPQAACRTQ